MISKSELLIADPFKGYIELVKEDDITIALKKNTKQFRKLLESIPRKKYDHAYAEGKWTIREMIQHIIDAERVFSYRALRFARKDATPLPGFDENSWAANSMSATRKWKDLLEEFRAVREATELFYDSLSDEQLRFRGEASGNPLNAHTLGFIIAGHATHHMNILQERYL